jgi:ketosteroid isomerase-like protein
MKIVRLFVAAGALALAGCNQAGGNADPAMRKLADRIAIGDLMNDYYANFGGSVNEDFAKYYTEDAVFDVNGLVYHGHKEIVGLYDTLGSQNALPPGTFHRLITNPQIEVNGDTATAKFLWTGVMNDKIDGPPHFQEQGREYDLLVKQNGKWLIKKRTVIADSGLPAMFRKTYKPRKDYDITKDD